MIMRHAVLAATALLATAIAARGADLPERQIQPYAPPCFNWSGFYIGANIGGAWGQRSWTDSAFGINFNSGKTGLIGGGQLGANFQTGNIVFGAEWDFDFNGVNGNNDDTSVFVPAVGSNIVVTSSSRWISTFAPRFGVALDRVLIYGKVGGGWAGTNGFAITNLATGASIAGGNNVATGWLVGGGIEWSFGAFINGWTVRLEYARLGLSNWSYTVPATSPFVAGDTITASNRNIQMVRIGFNFLFNSPIGNRYY
jgi:outer membrane immunogenic protein